MGAGNRLGSITAITGNALIVLAHCRNCALQSALRALFCTLAISDFGVSLVAQPLTAAYSFAIDVRVYCIVGSSVVGLASFWTSTVVALDRYLALMLQTRYHLIVTVKSITYTLALGWLLAAFFTFSSMLSSIHFDE